MKAILFTLVALALSCGGISAPEGVPGVEAHWRKLLSKVRLGMRRAAVEQVLARTDAVLDIDLDPQPEKEKRGRTAIYLFDENWCAAVTFDSSGFTTRNNPYLVLHLPENKVMASPKLLRRDEALNKKIEQYNAQ